MVGKLPTHAPREHNITWEEFKEGFRGAHIPRSILKIKKRELDDLKQRGMSVTEYNGQFTQLSRYAYDEHMTENKKMEKIPARPGTSIKMPTDCTHLSGF